MLWRESVFYKDNKYVKICWIITLPMVFDAQNGLNYARFNQDLTIVICTYIFSKIKIINFFQFFLEQLKLENKQEQCCQKGWHKSGRTFDKSTPKSNHPQNWF